jgi:hypothetical protein
MNPMLAAALGAILRWALAFLAGYLVNAGIWKSAEAETYVGAAVLGLLGLGWSVWQKYKSRIKFLAALNAPAGTAEANLDTRGITLKSAPVVLLAALLTGTLALGACSPKVPPTVGPAGKIAWQAKNVTDAASTALKGIELFTDQGLIPKATAIQVIQAIRQVGLGGNALASALQVYAESKGANGGIEIRTTIQNIQKLVTDALVLVPDLETRKRVQQITQPILDALAAILIPLDSKLDPTPTELLTNTVLAVDWGLIVADADAALARLN